MGDLVAGGWEDRETDEERWLTYSGVHQRNRRVLGPADGHPCVDCPEQATNWSYDGGCAEERRSDDGRNLAYCLHPEHYSSRCPRCHRRHDRGPDPHCARGHPLTGPDADLVPAALARGVATCRTCQTDRNRERAAVMRSAARALGMGWRDYRTLFGESAAMALSVLWAAEVCSE